MTSAWLYSFYNKCVDDADTWLLTTNAFTARHTFILSLDKF